ncbi:hypothetical protein P8C59_005938 [Phyllachora maydis]|uniref:NAD-dependent epimerase/dehydratase domain-containing protein n=1 Tax=Phyllachora maydis TaxID=1825666 RepID=A0AAD9MF02_9PEZI|nr:hypothetical protein P8C59_005938 [Phyllachora maydis]
MPTSKNLVLITGATGHVGSTTLLHLLRAGYNVRAAVRTESKAAAIRSRPHIQRLNPGSRLTFTCVPDITAPGAYDDAIEGVTHVVHIASPLVTGDMVPLSQHDAYFIQPAVRGTLNMLEAANRAGTVRRVVMTSSIVALIPCDEMEGAARRDPSRPISPNDRVPFVEGPYHSEFAAYAASKVAALAQAETWMARERPAFDVVYLHPSFVLGRNDAATTPAQAMKGTNAVVLAMLLGKRFGPYAGASVHVDDVARVHVAALEPTVLGNQSYILSQSAVWNDAKTIAHKSFPEARLIVNGGNVDSTSLPIDASLTEDTFGFEHISFEQQVHDLVGQFLELRIKQKAVSSSKAQAATAGRGEMMRKVSALG